MSARHSKAKGRVLLVGICLMCSSGLAGRLFADDEVGQKLAVTETQKAEFPAGGLLRFEHSFGYLTIEGWLRPDIELTVVKSTRDEYSTKGRERAASELAKIQVSMEVQGQEVVVTTRSSWSFGVPSHFAVSYIVKVPEKARIAIQHESGEVVIDKVDSDIEAAQHHGGMILHLRGDGQYNIEAKTEVGGIRSDFPGHETRRLWQLGHRWFGPSTPVGHNLHLKMGAGDITILKAQTPPLPNL